MNFIGRYVYVGSGKGGYDAVAVAEHDEPPAIIGSDFQKVAYPEDYSHFTQSGKHLNSLSHHSGTVLDVQQRGEYLYTATGKGGLRVYDIANVDNKDISQRTITAPVSALGQKFYVKTKFAQAVASPSTLAIDPLRTHREENEDREIKIRDTGCRDE